MKQKPHKFLGITSTLLALLTLMPSAYADPTSETPAPTAPATATTKDPALITEIANTLRRSDALMTTFANAPSEEVTRQYLEVFASTMPINSSLWVCQGNGVSGSIAREGRRSHDDRDNN